MFAGIPDCRHGPQDCVLNVTVFADSNDDDSSGTVVSENILPLALPSALRLPDTNVSYTVSDVVTDGRAKAVQVSLTSTSTAVYVWLSTLEQGRFSDNAFFLVPGVQKIVEFLPFDKASTSAAALKASLRVEHLKMYM
jgi:hypothetical protein